MCTSCLIHSSFGLGESASKRHLDRFSRFCTAHRWAQHAHSPTDRHTSRHFVCSMVALTMQAMRPKWKSLQESDDIVSRSPALPARQKCVTRNCELDGAISVKLQEACIVEHWNKILSLIVCVKSTIFFRPLLGLFSCPFFLSPDLSFTTTITTVGQLKRANPKSGNRKIGYLYHLLKTDTTKKPLQ